MRLKKVVYYIPAITFTVFYGFAATWSIGAISPIIAIWLALFFISGFILNKNIFWGGLFGVLPAIHLIYLGTQETGQIINEMPTGILVLGFYVLCGYFVYRNNK